VHPATAVAQALDATGSAGFDVDDGSGRDSSWRVIALEKQKAAEPPK